MSIHLKVKWFLFLLVICAALISRLASASTSAELIELSFEELVNLDVEIESAGKNSTKALDLAYAGYVLMDSEILASGVQSIPDALRLIPGVNVAQISTAEWSIGIRGAGGRFSRFVLVMVDGRIAYNSVFSGVNWDELNISVQNIQRIEVIRGPNAAAWGPNAVNGIIHIITRDLQRDMSHGTLVAGDSDAKFSGAFSHALDHGWYIGGSVSANRWDGLSELSSKSEEEAFEDRRIGASVKRIGDNEQLNISVEAFEIDLSPTWSWVETDSFEAKASPSDEDKKGWIIHGSYERAFGESTNLAVRGYADETQRNNSFYRWDSNNYQIDLELQSTLGRHEFSSGINLRQNTSDVLIRDRFDIYFSPQKRTVDNYGIYLSDTITFTDQLQGTAAVRWDHSALGGTNTQPSLRVLWAATDVDRFWAAVSEAATTPSRALTDINDVLYHVQPAADPVPPIVFVLDGYRNDQENTQVRAFEFGYRKVFGDYSLDLALFQFDYTNELEVELVGEPQLQPGPLDQPVLHQQMYFVNTKKFETGGGELVFRGNPTKKWTTQAVLSHVENLDDSTLSNTTVVLSSSFEFVPDVQLYLAARYNKGTTVMQEQYRLLEDQFGSVDDYIVFDFNLNWNLSDRWSVDFIGRNIGKTHTEGLREQFAAPIVSVEPKAMIRAHYTF